jgi:hypothetical protein
VKQAPQRTGRRPPAPLGKPGRAEQVVARPVVKLPTWFTERSTAAGVALAAGLFLLGLLVGGLGAFAYATRIHGLTVGVVVALLAEGGVVAAAGVWNAARTAAVLPALGWVVSVLVFASERPEGDLIIAATDVGYGYVLGGLLLLGGLIALPYQRIAGWSGDRAKLSR